MTIPAVLEDIIREIKKEKIPGRITTVEDSVYNNCVDAILAIINDRIKTELELPSAKPTRAELTTGLLAAIAALEYAAAEAPLAADEIWMHVNGVGGPDIRELVKRTK